MDIAFFCNTPFLCFRSMSTYRYGNTYLFLPLDHNVPYLFFRIVHKSNFRIHPLPYLVPTILFINKFVFFLLFVFKCIGKSVCQQYRQLFRPIFAVPCSIARLTLSAISCVRNYYYYAWNRFNSASNKLMESTADVSEVDEDVDDLCRCVFT